jgi:hypothetical protein
MTSISSNFSTNITELIPPGVIGRYDTDNIIFKDQEFKPQKMVDSNGTFVVLSKDKRNSFLFTYDAEEGYIPIPSNLDEFMYFYEFLECSDIDAKDDDIFFLCYNGVEYKNDQVGVDLSYYIFVLNVSTNKIVMNQNFKGPKIENPKLRVVKLKNAPLTMFVIIFPKLTKTLRRKTSKFKPKSRLIFVKLKKSFKFKLGAMGWVVMEHFLMNVETQIEKTNKDNISLINFMMRKNGEIFAHYGKTLFSLSLEKEFITLNEY